MINTKWVLRNKQDEFGVITKNKARLVGKGYTQVKAWRSPPPRCRSKLGAPSRPAPELVTCTALAAGPGGAGPRTTRVGVASLRL
jgi:hypothetical protein